MNIYSVSVEDFSTNPESLIYSEDFFSKDMAENFIKKFLFSGKYNPVILISIIKNDEKYLDFDKEGNIEDI